MKIEKEILHPSAIKKLQSENKEKTKGRPITTPEYNHAYEMYHTMKKGDSVLLTTSKPGNLVTSFKRIQKKEPFLLEPDNRYLSYRKEGTDGQYRFWCMEHE